jgi:hypothetical protein
MVSPGRKQEPLFGRFVYLNNAGLARRLSAEKSAITI